MSGGRLDLDIIGNDESFETQRFEVVLTGFDFDSIECFSGAREALGGCSFERGEADDLVAVIEPFAPGEGITVSGSIASLVTSTLPSSPEPPGAIPIGLRLFAGGEAVELGAYDKEATDDEQGHEEVDGVVAVAVGQHRVGDRLGGSDHPAMM